jgi:uncharacterized protein (DUF1800 family)
MLKQYRLFLDLGLGPFGALLDRVTKDPAMIRWLDNESNRKGHPNENYARELFELFTLGDGHYGEADVKEAARAFTGSHVLEHRYHFSMALHDEGEKMVLGRTGAFRGEDVCRIALEQEACGRFLAGKLLRFFLAPEPPPDVVAAFGAELQACGYDFQAALKLLFASRCFFAPENRRVLVKSPLEFVAGAARAFGLKLDAAAAVPGLRAMGQDLLAPPNVKGWAGHREWVNTATWIARVREARRLAAGHDGRGLAAGWEAFAGGAPPATDRLDALLSTPEAHVS